MVVKEGLFKLPRKPKAPINPNKPLKNPRYEIMARKLAQGSTQVEAYKTAYPNANQTTANSQAHEVIKREGINERAVKLLESVGLSEKKLAQKLNQHVESDTESISLDATKHGLKLIGYGQDSKDSGQQVYNPVQVIIQQMTVNPLPQPIDTTIDTTSTNDT